MKVPYDMRAAPASTAAQVRSSDEAADEDRLRAVPLKKDPCALQVRLVEMHEAPIAPHQRGAACPPHPIAAVVANDGRGDRGRHDCVDREVPQRGPGGCRDQRCLAWERDPEALQADQEEENDVAVGCNEPGYSLLHAANCGGRARVPSSDVGIVWQPQGVRTASARGA